MRIAVAGLGAMGGMIAARLAQGGAEVSGLRAGATLEAVRLARPDAGLQRGAADRAGCG